MGQSYFRQWVSILAVAVVMLFSTTTQAAESYTTSFPVSGDTVETSTGPWGFWMHEGDYAEGERTTSLNQVDKMDYAIKIAGNALVGDAVINLDVYLNNHWIGPLVVAAGETSVSGSWEFTPIVGPDYTIKVQETNTLDFSEGAIILTPDLPGKVTLYEPLLPGIIEGHVTVFPPPQRDHIRRIGFQEIGILGTGPGGIRGLAGDWKEGARLDKIEKMLPQEMGETRFVVWRYAEIFVHMKHPDPRPLDFIQSAQRAQKGELRIAGCQHDIGLSAFGQRPVDDVERIQTRRLSHFFAAAVDAHGQMIVL